MTAGNPKRTRRRWVAAAGGNRLHGLQQALLGAGRLDPAHERRKISLAPVHFGERWLDLSELERREARADRRRNARHLKDLGWIVLPIPEWRRRP
jgi:hypothetical protein